MVNGYAGRLLFVDLTAGTMAEETPPEDFYRACIGGTGLGAKILMERTQAGIDPLGPEQHAGLRDRASHRHGRVRRGALHGHHQVAAHRRLGRLQRGWHLGTGVEERRLRRRLLHRRGGPSRVPGHRRGKRAASRTPGTSGARTPTRPTTSCRRSLGDPGSWTIACIGPAGEKRSLLAGIVNEKGRIAARSGVGAVMGSKKLKAVAVRGAKGTRIAWPTKRGSRRSRSSTSRPSRPAPFSRGFRPPAPGPG